ncbi:DUF4369 domain-containing protein [Larkinella punicea]|uniref:DUF4369 domain-containing protein n=1 Tax=Larkinella punicea TaxID=2315727 RepID=A0A368JLX9_9BACT|nr:DUF4369 domain-containing protein [Larkinella punicea]RCR68660.1 DUF4369 domain-containing protein [Larkinella punicea]
MPVPTPAFDLMQTAQRLSTFLLLFLGTLCFAQQHPGYRVIGHIRGLPDQTKMYLIDGGKRQVIDSAVVRQERFVFDGSMAEAAHTYLYAGKGSVSFKLADILLDNRTVEVEGTKPVYDSVTVNGSDIDRLWKEWGKEDQQIGYQRFRIKQVQEALAAQKDTARAGILKKIMDEMTASRIELLKSYVKRYHSTAVGAALPTLCTLGNYLTKADYLEMYRTLSPTWQNSGFGREILEQAGAKGNRVP